MTQHELLAEAARLEALEAEADGSWAEYLHARAQWLRYLAAEAEEP